MLGQLLVLCVCLLAVTCTPLPMYGMSHHGPNCPWGSGHGQFMQGALLGGNLNGGQFNGYPIGGQTYYPQGGQMYNWGQGGQIGSYPQGGQMYNWGQGGQIGSYPQGGQMYNWGQGGQIGSYPHGGQMYNLGLGGQYYPQFQGGFSPFNYGGAMGGAWAAGHTSVPQIPYTWPSTQHQVNDVPDVDWWGHKYPRTGGSVIGSTDNSQLPFYMQNWQATGVQPR